MGFSEMWRQRGELLGEFRATQQQRENLVVGPYEPPHLLHHYTTLNGLRGIIASRSFWASDARYLNDASELSYAVDLINEVVLEIVEELGSEKTRQTLSQTLGLRPIFANRTYQPFPFVACFCEERDLLSQWRGYRAGETGYSLGMELGRFVRHGNLPPNTYLRKVVYDVKKQRQEVREVAEVWLRTAESLLSPQRHLRPGDVFPDPALWALEEALAEHYLCFKHPTFAEEREWRLIKLVSTEEERILSEGISKREKLGAAQRQHISEALERAAEYRAQTPDLPTAWSNVPPEGIEIQFRELPGGLAPFVQLPLCDADMFEDRLPLRQVIQGALSTSRTLTRIPMDVSCFMWLPAA